MEVTKIFDCTLHANCKYQGYAKEVDPSTVFIDIIGCPPGEQDEYAEHSLVVRGKPHGIG